MDKDGNAAVAEARLKEKQKREAVWGLCALSGAILSLIMLAFIPEAARQNVFGGFIIFNFLVSFIGLYTGKLRGAPWLAAGSMFGPIVTFAAMLFMIYNNWRQR